MTAISVRRFLACDSFRALMHWLRRMLSQRRSRSIEWPPRHLAELALMERNAQAHRHPASKQRVKAGLARASAPMPDKRPPRP